MELEQVEVELVRPWGTVACGTHGADPGGNNGWVIIETDGQLVTASGVRGWKWPLAQAKQLTAEVAACDTLAEAVAMLAARTLESGKRPEYA